MGPDHRIDRLAVHYIDSKKQKLTTADGEVIFSTLDPLVQDFLSKIVNKVLAQEEKGDTYSANFSEEKPLL